MMDDSRRLDGIFGGEPFSANCSYELASEIQRVNEERREADAWRFASHQLIILGNGFGLECGLHSTFGDFFAEREGRLFPSEEELSRAGRGDEAVSWGEYFAASDEQLNAWDIILREHSGGNWYDIESAITEWVGSGFERAYADIADKINSSPAEVALALVNSCSACRTRPTP